MNQIETSAQGAINKNGRFNFVMPGGDSPKIIFSALKNINTEWDKWHCYLSDERCLPVDDELRNSTTVTKYFLGSVPAKPFFYPIPAELGAPNGAAVYEMTLKNISTFDLTLLGIGEDGHTASLFPNPDLCGMYAADVVPILRAPKFPTNRITLSPGRLSRSDKIIYIASGLAKEKAITKGLLGQNLPFTEIRGLNTTEICLLI